MADKKKPKTTVSDKKPSSAERKIALRRAQSAMLSTSKGQQYAQMMAGHLGRAGFQQELRR